MTTTKMSHEINCDEDTFWKLFLDKEFNEKLYRDGLGFPEFSVLEQRETDTQILRKAAGQPKMNMPGPVAKLLGNNFRYVEDELAYLFLDAGARVIVYQGCFAETLASVLPRLERAPLLLRARLPQERDRQGQPG